MAEPDPDLFDHLAEILLEHQLGVDAAHLHGSLCGYLTSGGQAEGTLWLDQLLQHPGISTELSEPARTLLSNLYRATQAQLADPLLGPSPLLPLDDSELSVRVNALNDWCSGYLGGLGLGGRFTGKRQLSREGREAINDLERIARSVIELDDDTEGDENALAELVEFVRVSMQLLYYELAEFANDRTPARRDRTH